MVIYYFILLHCHFGIVILAVLEICVYGVRIVYAYLKAYFNVTSITFLVTQVLPFGYLHNIALKYGGIADSVKYRLTSDRLII